MAGKNQTVEAFTAVPGIFAVRAADHSCRGFQASAERRIRRPSVTDAAVKSFFAKFGWTYSHLCYTIPVSLSTK